jgi:hypothetical protein
MTERTLDNLAGDPSANPARRALALLDEKRPRAWRWDDDGADVAGTLQGTRRMADRFREGQTVLVLDLALVEDGERVLVYCSPPLERMLAGHGPRIGDGIAIRRGQLVERKDAPTFRAWDVEVVPADGTVAWDAPEDLDNPSHLEGL